jgi:hypothetical protein
MMNRALRIEASMARPPITPVREYSQSSLPCRVRFSANEAAFAPAGALER